METGDYIVSIVFVVPIFAVFINHWAAHVIAFVWGCLGWFALMQAYSDLCDMRKRLNQK